MVARLLLYAHIIDSRVQAESRIFIIVLLSGGSTYGAISLTGVYRL